MVCYLYVSICLYDDRFSHTDTLFAEPDVESYEVSRLCSANIVAKHIVNTSQCLLWQSSRAS